LKDVKGTSSRTSTDLDIGGPEIDTGSEYSNFAAAYQVMARLPGLRTAMLEALSSLDKELTECEMRIEKAKESTGQVIERNQSVEDLRLITAHKAAIVASLIATNKIRHMDSGTVKSRLVERVMRDAMDSGMIDAENSPEDIVDVITSTIEQYAPGSHVWKNLFAKKLVVKDEKIGKLDEESTVLRVSRRGTVLLVRDHERYEAKNAPVTIDLQREMLTMINKVTKGEYIRLPLEFGSSQMLQVRNGALGKYVASGQLASPDGTGSEAESGVVAAMQQLFNGKKILQQFEWNGDEWQEREDSDRPEAGQTAYRLASAIIHTKWDDDDEYLFVHWSKDKPNSPFVKGKQWIKAFNERKDTSPDLGEVRTLFYERV
jgi:regulator of replication initiation timing